MGVDKKLEKKVFTIQEIWAAMRGSVEKSKKKYTRKDKHKKSGGEGYKVSSSPKVITIGDSVPLSFPYPTEVEFTPV